jgi:repressor LexA
MKNLTPRQHEVYEFIRNFMAAKSYCPSLREIGAGVGLRSVATVSKHVDNLRRKGALLVPESDSGKYRNFRLLRPLKKAKKCPHCGNDI